MNRTKSKSKAAAAISDASGPAPDSPSDVTRYVPLPVQFMLWGVAAGRCELSGCNTPLWKSSVTQEQVNIAEKAHIYAFSSDGPRGNAGVPKDKLNDVSNLLLVCPACHKEIDQQKDGGRFTVPILRQMKAQHERRIEIVTEIDSSKRSHVVLYGANVGEHSSPLTYTNTAPALFPDRYPADNKAIALGMIDSASLDRDGLFWTKEADNLVARFSQRVRDRLSCGDIEHLSIFARAPQPLLILLGSLLTDIPGADVFQLHREPQGWAWPTATEKPAPFELREPARQDGMPALALSLSATVTEDRITAVIGSDASIWTVTIASPHNDFTKSRQQLTEFRKVMRPLLDRIKARHGQNTVLHIFPAASVSVAVELGRVRMPKADMPWQIYDQVNHRGGFIPALSIPYPENNV